MSVSTLAEPPIVRESRRFRKSLHRPEDLVATFRTAALYIQCSTEDKMLPVVRVDGIPWLPVFSDLRFLAEYLTERGQGSEATDYLVMTGARLLDLYLAGMPRGTSVLLDPGQPHAVALPALVGFVPEDIALDRDQPDRPTRTTVDVSPYERPVSVSWQGVL